MPARPGRPRKPTALRVVEGKRGHRPLPEHEPRPDPTMPTCPRGLSPAARRVWRRLAPQLHKARLLTEWDRETLAAYCEAWAQHQAARTDLRARGQLVPGRLDGLVVNPSWRVFRDSALLIRAFAGEFGLTPSARAGIEMPEADEHDPTIFAPARRRSSS